MPLKTVSANLVKKGASLDNKKGASLDKLVQQEKGARLGKFGAKLDNSHEHTAKKSRILLSSDFHFFLLLVMSPSHKGG